MADQTDLSLPEGMGRITPHLVCDGAQEAIAFYEKAFDAKTLTCLKSPEGKVMHACLTLNGSSIFLNDEFREMGAVGPKQIGGTPVTIHLFVADADAFAVRAIAAGAREIMPVADQFWGDRYGMVEDPFGHRWAIATPSGTVMSEEEIHAAMKEAMPS